MTSTTQRILHYLHPGLPGFLAALVCMVTNALATGLYAYLIGPVVKFLFTGGLKEQDSLTSFLRGMGLEPQLERSDYLLWALPLLILFSALLKGASQYGKFYLMGWVGERGVYHLRADLLQKLHRLPVERYDLTPSGDLISRIASDLPLLQEAVTHAAATVVSDSMKVLVLLGLALWLDWRLALVTLVILPLVAWPIVNVGKRLKNTATDRQRQVSDIVSHVREDIRAQRVIRDFNLSQQRLKRFKTSNRAYLGASLRSFRIRALASPLMEIIGAVGLGATIWLAARRIGSGELAPEHFVSFFASLLLLYEPMKNLGRVNTYIQSGRAGADRVFELLDWPDERQLDRGRQQVEELHDRLCFENLHFGYGERQALCGVDFSLQAGQTVALVGESGAGKSTLLRLLLRHFEPDTGRITIDGIALSDITLDSIRRLVVSVEQRPLLFDTTIGENIQLARPEAKEAQLWEAIERAQLRTLIENLPQGLHTPIGEGGARLSEGERQRVALARAFIKGAPVIVLDEVTSALDAHNEAAIARAIEEIGQERTVLMIAHRLSSVRHADKVVVMHQGRVVEEGRPEQLTAQNGPYRKLLESQGIQPTP